jgi:Cdc6-like AAA superfamily ATPase
MIDDARVLQEEFIPREIKHRDAETSHLSDALNPPTRGERGETAFLYGPFGAGENVRGEVHGQPTAGERARR